MNNKKIIELPVPVFLYKYLKAYTDNDGLLNMPFDLPCENYKDLVTVRRYFEFASHYKYPLIKVNTYSMTANMQYGLQRYFRQLFFRDLYAFINSHVKTYFEIKTAIQLFCNQYNISEDDYKIETIIKKYQRFRKLPRHKRLFV